MILPSDLDHHSIALIEKLKYLLTVEIRAVVGRHLEFRVAGGEVLDDPHTIAGVQDVRSIEVTSKSDIYAFTFHDFIAYSVTDEQFIQHWPKAVGKGNLVASYTKSHLLSYVAATTWATSDYPGKLLHYQVNTLDHTIDVVTAKFPTLVMEKGAN